MDANVKELNVSEHELEVTLSYDEIQPEIENAYKEERKNISIPGFRKGKVPMHMLKKMYGDAIEYKASEKIANKKFWDIVDEKSLKPISTPSLSDLDFVPGEKLFFKVKYEVKPEIELKDYKNLEIDKMVFKVKDEDVEHEIEHLLKDHAQFEPVDKVEDKNIKITVNLQRMDDKGTPIVGSRTENFVVDLSSHGVNPQMIENSMNKSVGDTFNFSFVDEREEDGSKVKEDFNYEAEIVKIEKITMPEENEELFKKLSGDKAKSMDELRAMIKENFEQYYANQSENIYINTLLNRVVANNEFDPPKSFVEIILKNLINAEIENAKRSNMPAPSEEELRGQLYERAVWNAKWQIIMESLAKKENIEVSDADLEEVAKTESEKTGISVEKLVNYYKSSHRDDSILEEKVVNFLKENNKAKEIDADKVKKTKKDN